MGEGAWTFTLTPDTPVQSCAAYYCQLNITALMIVIRPQCSISSCAFMGGNCAHSAGVARRPALTRRNAHCTQVVCRAQAQHGLCGGVAVPHHRHVAEGCVHLHDVGVAAGRGWHGTHGGSEGMAGGGRVTTRRGMRAAVLGLGLPVDTGAAVPYC